MIGARPLSLGTKINIGLLVFLLLLAAAASAIIFYGFQRAQDDAAERSQEALEEQGKLALQAVVGGVSDAGALQLEWAAEVGQRAARYMEEYKATRGPAQVDVSGFARTEEGIWYDPDPARGTDVVVPNHVDELGAAHLDDIAYSAALDPLLPALTEGFPGELSGAGFRPMAVIFVGVNGVGRYYPPIGVHETTPPELDVSDFFDRFGPVANPSRETVWTPPYEDIQGRGLVITAQTPVYDGDTFRGIFEVDLAIDGLAEELDGIHPTPNGFAFYVDSTGTIMRSDVSALLDDEAAGNADLASMIEAMGRAEPLDRPAVEEIMLDDGEPYFIAHMPMPSVGGSIAAAAPVEEVTAQAAQITEGITDEGTRTLQIMLAALAALFVLGLAGATYLNRRLVTAPVQRLAAAARQVAGGDLTANVALDRRDELGDLASDFNTMVGQLRESERVLEQRVEDRTRELTGLLEVTRVVTSTLQLRPLLDLVLEQTAVVLQHDRFVIMLRDGDDLQMLAVRAAEGAGDGALSRVSARLPVSQTPVLWDALQRGEPLIIDDVQADEPLAAAYRAELGAFAGPELLRFRSWMGIPLMTKSDLIGIMAVVRYDPRAYGPPHAALGKAIASQVAIAIENAQLFEQTQRQASLEERQRLARELHDSVSQALYGIALGTRTARMRLGDDPHNAAEPIDYVASLAQAGLAEMRALIFELRPESLEQEGVVSAIEKQAASTQARFGVQIAADLGEEPECALETKEALYRIAQEALHNMVKHAQASRADVRLRREGDDLVLTVADDGRGFDTNASFPGHIGLHSMAERAQRLGGRIEIESRDGEGTRVTARIPAPTPHNAGAAPSAPRSPS